MMESRIRIALNRPVTSGIFLMGLESPEIAGRARPGQFVMIRARDGKDPLLRRPFSICGVRSDGLFLILYRVVGRGTRLMAEKSPGGSLSILGPLGRGFEVGDDRTLPILVGGGIGTAPLFFMAQDLQRRGLDFRFLTGFGSSGEIITPERIGNPPADISVATDDGSEGRKGPVTALLAACLEGHGSQGERASIYSCGPSPMIKTVAALSRASGLACQVSLEATMACGVGACLGCAVKASSLTGKDYHYVCRDGPVFEADQIDWDEY